MDGKSGAYLEVTLHFMAEKDMVVHLTSANSSESSTDGTAVLSETAGLPEAMRISFAADNQTWIYDPGMGNESSTQGSMKTFGLPGADRMTLTDDNAMFSLKQGKDKAVVMHMCWKARHRPVLMSCGHRSMRSGCGLPVTAAKDMKLRRRRIELSQASPLRGCAGQ